MKREEFESLLDGVTRDVDELNAAAPEVFAELDPITRASVLGDFAKAVQIVRELHRLHVE